LFLAAQPMATLPAARRRPARKTGAEPVALRQRILQTAEALLETEGLQALSLREVARRAGVTHQAPYHHFADRESILAELVMQGFDDLAQRLAQAIDLAGTAGPRTALMESGSAYVGYAIEHPGVFRIMFRRELCDASRFPAAQAASARAHRELLRMVAVLHGGAQDAALTSTYWSMVHGLAGLIIDGPLAEHLPTLATRRSHMRATLKQFADFVLGPEAL
jgi:AcrR family transcriptional regulator